MSELDSTRLRELLSYDPATGVFTRKVGSPRSPVGSIAGGSDHKGHWVIRVNAKKYFAHRLAWLYVHGVWPAGVVDHINGDGMDNRIDNLRDVTQSVNMQNLKGARKDNRAAKLLGVTWSKQHNRWRANITITGKATFLGLFNTAEEAHAAYVAAKRQHHAGNTL